MVVGNSSGVYRIKTLKPKVIPNVPMRDTIKMVIFKPSVDAAKKEKIRKKDIFK